MPGPRQRLLFSFAAPAQDTIAALNPKEAPLHRQKTIRSCVNGGLKVSHHGGQKVGDLLLFFHFLIGLPRRSCENVGISPALARFPSSSWVECEAGLFRLKPRKHYTGEEKVAVLSRRLLEQKQISKLSDESGLQPTVYYRWQKEFFENWAPRPRAEGAPTNWALSSAR
jgi:hypothetical protein